MGSRRPDTGRGLKTAMIGVALSRLGGGSLTHVKEPVPGNTQITNITRTSLDLRSARKLFAALLCVLFLLPLSEVHLEAAPSERAIVVDVDHQGASGHHSIEHKAATLLCGGYGHCLLALLPDRERGGIVLGVGIAMWMKSDRLSAISLIPALPPPIFV